MGQPRSIGARLCDACKHFGAYTGLATAGSGARFSPLSTVVGVSLAAAGNSTHDRATSAGAADSRSAALRRTTGKAPHRWGSATANRWCCGWTPGACIATACRSSRPTTAYGSPRRFRQRS
ncbi:conserved domain protein [Xanthomonas citri pv. mangiferaeindicae LMG 941]|nr:conserved domain protein [Xanthomonas citri pv. mangiferaeindicae LMG 941]